MELPVIPLILLFRMPVHQPCVGAIGKVVSRSASNVIHTLHYPTSKNWDFSLFHYLFYLFPLPPIGYFVCLRSSSPTTLIITDISLKDFVLKNFSFKASIKYIKWRKKPVSNDNYLKSRKLELALMMGFAVFGAVLLGVGVILSIYGSNVRSDLVVLGFLLVFVAYVRNVEF